MLPIIKPWAFRSGAVEIETSINEPSLHCRLHRLATWAFPANSD
ncbi:hypothetical protein QUB68_08840 [Microcoleus sp. A006_D1]